MTIDEAWTIIEHMIDRTYTNQDYDDALAAIGELIRKYTKLERKTLYIGTDVRCDSCRHWIASLHECKKLEGKHEIGCGLWEVISTQNCQ